MAANPAATTGVVGEGAVLNGKVKGHDLTVFGVLEGELLLEGRLLVGPNGRVAARVRAKEVQVDGAIEGEVNAASIILGETARARGTFVAKRLVVKEGALVEGSINPGTEAAAEPVPAPPAPTSAPPAPPDAGEAAPKDGADGPTV